MFGQGGKPFTLSEHERQSALWLKLKAHLDERLALLRARNDKPRDEAKSNLLRGQLAELKHLLSLNEEKRTPPPEDELFQD